MAWDRCHICQTRFPRDEFSDHESCIKREIPTDYDDGYDAVQYTKLISKEMFPSKSSDETCWYMIFKLLFPDWPENEELPSPCAYFSTYRFCCLIQTVYMVLIVMTNL